MRGKLACFGKLNEIVERTGNSVGIVFAGTYGRCSVFDILMAQLLCQFEMIRSGSNCRRSVEACVFGAKDSIRWPKFTTKDAITSPSFWTRRACINCKLQLPTQIHVIDH